MRSKNEIEYDSCTKVYHFTGEQIPLPATGTYDSSAWTPPSRRRYDVYMQSDGLWWLEQNGAKVASGDGQSASRANAIKIVLAHRASLSGKE